MDQMSPEVMALIEKLNARRAAGGIPTPMPQEPMSAPMEQPSTPGLTPEEMQELLKRLR